MKFWKEHAALRMGLMLGTFVLGFALILFGWRQTGELWGLAVMLAGIGVLLACLSLYNKPFEEPKAKKGK